MKYRTKLPVVEAWQYTRDNKNTPDWIKSAFQGGKIRQHPVSDALLVDSGPTTQEAVVGDWIVRVRGNLAYALAVFKPEEFEEQFEPVKQK